MQRHQRIEQHQARLGYYVPAHRRQDVVFRFLVRLGDAHERRKTVEHQSLTQVRIRFARQRVARAKYHFLWRYQELGRSHSGDHAHPGGAAPHYDTRHTSTISDEQKRMHHVAFGVRWGCPKRWMRSWALNLAPRCDSVDTIQAKQV